MKIDQLEGSARNAAEQIVSTMKCGRSFRDSLRMTKDRWHRNQFSEKEWDQIADAADYAFAEWVEENWK